MKTVRIEKYAGSVTVSPEQLERINLFTRRELAADEVFVFSVILCDNEIDRDGEQFPAESLEKLGELFIGKTGVFDHDPKAENQSARIFETALEQNGKNSLGEPYTALKAWAYMVRCDKNDTLILEIDAGIKKEVSVGCAVEKIVCSVCGCNRKTETCQHEKGETYDGEPCRHLLLNPTDAYEWSFVAVPAQKNAGVIKKHKREGAFMELSKLFEQKSDVVLTKADIAAIKPKFEKLAVMAEVGKAYRESLRREVVKLAALSQPSLSASVMEAIAKKLDVNELLELTKTFGEAARREYPLTQGIQTQLDGNISPAAKSADEQFKI